jgi:hypothetical protein
MGISGFFSGGQSTGWVQTNPLVFWYQWDYLRSPAKNLSFAVGYLRLAMFFS